MASTQSYHLMKTNGATRGKTGGEDSPGKAYTYKRGDIVEAPKTEFNHLPEDSVETFSDEKKAEKAREDFLGK